MKINDALKERTGFIYDRASNLYYQEKDGYQFAMSFYGSQYYLMSCVSFENAPPEMKAIRERLGDVKPIKSVTCQGYRTVYVLKAGLTQNRLIENIEEAFSAVLSFYKENGYRNC